MRGLATILLQEAVHITGSDIASTVHTKQLEKLGATIKIGHDHNLVELAESTVYSSAISPDNPEIKLAKSLGKPLLRRAELLGQLMDKYKKRIAIAGTHGKTTTTAMVCNCIEASGKAPTYMTGAERCNVGKSADKGDSHYFVTESDESDGTFLMLRPNVAVVTNIEEEHMNFFTNKENLLSHFTQFIEKAADAPGTVVLNKDDENCVTISENISNKKVLFFSIREFSDLQARDIAHHGQGISFNVYYKGQLWDKVQLQVYGIHNVYNALAAMGVALTEGINKEDILAGLKSYSGTARRFQKLGDVSNIQVYDDYAHHPTEIHLTLQSCKKSLKGRLIAIFQPHRYSRTKNFLTAFSQSFEAADRVIITDVYAAGEDPIPGAESKNLAELLKQEGKEVTHFADKAHVTLHLMNQLKPGDIVVTMGAGDIFKTGIELVEALETSVKDA